MKTRGDSPARRPYRMGVRADAAAATADRVLEVAFELFTERAYEDVGLEEIGRRAGVAKRTVLRRFGSKEELFVAAMMERARAEMRRRDATPVGDVVGAVATVVESYERFGANRLRLLAQEDRIPVVAENVEGGRRYHRSWVERAFAPLLDGLDGAARMRRFAALVALTDVYTWKLLRHDLGLGPEETVETLAEVIETLKGAP